MFVFALDHAEMWMRSFKDSCDRSESASSLIGNIGQVFNIPTLSYNSETSFEHTVRLCFAFPWLVTHRYSSFLEVLKIELGTIKVIQLFQFLLNRHLAQLIRAFESFFHILEIS